MCHTNAEQKAPKIRNTYVLSHIRCAHSFYVEPNDRIAKTMRTRYGVFGLFSRSISPISMGTRYISEHTCVSTRPFAQRDGGADGSYTAFVIIDEFAQFEWGENSTPDTISIKQTHVVSNCSAGNAHYRVHHCYRMLGTQTISVFAARWYALIFFTHILHSK